jgi:hypothetical protein
MSYLLDLREKVGETNNMQLSDYLLLFSNTGTTRVRVKFKGLDISIANQMMKPEEIVKLLSPHADGFISELTFDEHPFQVYKYEIDAIKNIFTIYARKQDDENIG